VEKPYLNVSVLLSQQRHASTHTDCSINILYTVLFYDNIYSPLIVARRENIYNMQLKQKITYVNLTTAQLNYRSSMTKLLAINSIIQQNTIQEKKKEITEGKIYSPSGKFAERAK